MSTILRCEGCDPLINYFAIKTKSLIMIFFWISIICFLLVNKSQAMPETATWPDTWPSWMKCYGRGLGKRVCAQLFDSEDCRQGMWGRDGYEVRDKGGEMETLPKRFQFDTESLIVKAGCTLYAYSDPLCRIFPGKLFHKFVTFLFDCNN